MVVASLYDDGDTKPLHQGSCVVPSLATMDKKQAEAFIKTWF
jgi:hypothetical protein